MSDYSKEGLLAKYKELVAQRDATVAKVASLQEALDKANTEAQKAREKAEKIALAISEAKGGAEWLTLKSTISTLAKTLSAKDGVLASK